MFKKSKRFGKAVGLINQVDLARLPQVLSRVLQKLPHKVHCARYLARYGRCDVWPGAHHVAHLCAAPRQTESAFSDAETAQLCELFELNGSQLQLLLSGCSYIFEEGAYATTPPAKLVAELVEAGVEHEQADIFAGVWRDGAEEFILQSKNHSVLAPQYLSAVDWQLAVETAHSSGARGQCGHALLELRLSSGAPMASSDSAHSVHMRLGKAELEELLAQLDKIQAQMDALVSSA